MRRITRKQFKSDFGGSLEALTGKSAKGGRASKYGNRKTEIDGIVFDSKREAARYSQLKLLQAHGAIQNLELQPKFDLIVEGKKIGFYKADFRYEENGAVKIEDAKGMRTAVYALKKRLVKAIYGIEIIEV